MGEAEKGGEARGGKLRGREGGGGRGQLELTVSWFSARDKISAYPRLAKNLTESSKAREGDVLVEFGSSGEEEIERDPAEDGEGGGRGKVDDHQQELVGKTEGGRILEYRLNSIR